MDDSMAKVPSFLKGESPTSANAHFFSFLADLFFYLPTSFFVQQLDFRAFSQIALSILIQWTFSRSPSLSVLSI